MMKIFLTSVFVLMLVTLCFGQFYEPEHIWHLCGDQPSGNWFGRYMAGIGDINGDGCDDFLLHKSTETPHVELFYGDDPPDTTVDIFFNNPYSYGYFGYSIENVRDLNGDGADDFTILGSYVQDDIARVFIYFGGTLVDTIPDVILSEVTSWDMFGSKIKGLGDINNDGFRDLAVWAPNYDHGRGKVWAYLGGSSMDSIADWSQEGSNQQVFYGQSIAGEGDMNGDGYDDFAIYEWTGYPNYAESNYYIFFGDTLLDTIPDLVVYGEDYYPEIDIYGSSAMICNLNGDPYSDLVIMAGRTENAIVLFGGNPMDTEIDLILGGFVSVGQWGMNVSTSGDVNRDGCDDIIAAQLDAYGQSGLVMVYLGSPWMDGQPDMEWQGIFTQYEGCGKSLTDCGDINGDGVDDIMFGSYHGNFNPNGCVDIWAGDTAFVVSVPEEMPQASPDLFQLHEPYPNPFNNTVTVPFEIFPGVNGDVSLIVYNVLGQLVADLRPAVRDAMKGQRTGFYEVIWDGKNPSGIEVGSGVYIVVLHISVHRALQKVALLR